MGAGRSTLLAGALMAACTEAIANPWLKDEGKGELISNVTLSREEGGLASGAVANATSDLHLEYGLAAAATLVLDADLQQTMRVGAPPHTDFDNAWAGARVSIMRWDDAVLSTEAEAGVSGIHDALSPRRLSLNGAAQARLMFGQGFSVLARHAFASIESGWRWRGGPPADEAFLDATLGIEPWESGLLMLQSFSIASTGRATGAYRDYALSKFQFSVAQGVGEHLWVQAGALDTVTGTDAGNVGVMFALWWRF